MLNNHQPEYLNHLKVVEERLLQAWFEPWLAVSLMKLAREQEGKPMLQELGLAPLPTEFGDWTYATYGDWSSGLHHELLVYGNIREHSLGNGEKVLVRLHSACRTNEVYHAVNCECRKELQEAMQMIQREGRGIIVYLEQEGRGTGIAGKMSQLDWMFTWENGKIVQRRDQDTGERIDTDRAYKSAGYPSECRDFSIAAELLKKVGVKSVRLLTNNPQKIAGLTQAGIPVEPVEIHIAPDNEIIASDLRSKAQNLGHSITEKQWAYQEETSAKDD